MSVASNESTSKGKERKDDDSLCYFGATHQQALELEISLLQSLLKRNRCSHQRTKYYQRLSMSLAAIRRYAIPQLYETLSALLTELQDKTRHYQQKRKREQVFWSNSTRSNQNDSTATKSGIQQLWIKSESVGRTSIVQGLPECLSRLEYAAQALFAETVRGFFLPFCTVAVAAISRIRTLLLRLGKFALQEYLPQLQSEWKALLLVVAPNIEQGGKQAGAAAGGAEVMQPNQLWGQESSESNGENDDDDDDDDDSVAFSRARTVLMTAVHEAVVDFGSRTKAERTQNMLKSLGLSSKHGFETSIPAKSNIAQENEETADVASTAEEEEEALSEMILPENPKVDDTAEEAADTGEAVHLREDNGKTPVSVEKTNPGFESTISADGVDRNSEIVHKLKAQNKKKKKKRKGVTTDSDAKSKKKKKRSKEDDFFDDLFAK